MLNTNRGLAGAIAAMLTVIGLAALTTQGVPTEVVLSGMGIAGTLGGATVFRNRDGDVAGIGAVVSYLDDVEERLRRAVGDEDSEPVAEPRETGL